MANAKVDIGIKATDKASPVIKKLDKSLGSLSMSAQGLASAMGAGYLVARLGEAAWEMGKLGAQSLDTKAAFKSMMESVGQSPQLLNQMKAAAGGTVSELKLMQGVNLALAGTTGTLAAAMAEAQPKMLEIARAAYKMNPALGSVEFLYQSLNTGIKRNQKLLVDNLGIVVNQTQAQERYAKSIGVTTKELTEEQKQLAFLNDVIGESGQTLIEQVGGVGAMGDAYAELDAKIQNLKASWGELAAGPIGGFVDDLIIAIDLVDALTRGEWLLVESIQDLGQAQRSYRKDATEANKATLDTAQNLYDLRSAAADAGGLITDYFVPTAEEMAAKEALIGAAAAAAAPDVEALAKAIQKTIDALASAPAWNEMPMQDLMETLMGGQMARGGKIAADRNKKLAWYKTDAEEFAKWLDWRVDKWYDAEAEMLSATEKAHRKQRSMLESIMSEKAQPFDATKTLDQMGRHIDTWDENRSRLIDVVNLGTTGEGQWDKYFEGLGIIPPEVIAAGEESIKEWAANEVIAFDRGERPELINMEALETQLRNAVQTEVNWEKIYSDIQARMGLSDTDMNLARGIYDPVQMTLDKSWETLDANRGKLNDIGDTMVEEIISGARDASGAMTAFDIVLERLLVRVLAAIGGEDSGTGGGR